MSEKNIGNLNFKVILDDKEFNEKILKDIKAADDLNTSLSELLEVKKKVFKITSDEAKTIKRADDLASNRVKNAEKERSLRARNKIIEDRMLETSERQRRNAESRLRTTQQLTPELSKQSRIFAEIRNQAAGIASIYAAERFVSSVIRVTGEFEAQKVALSSILQDAKMADTIFSQLKGLAVESPFRLKDLTAYAKQLSAFSVAKDDIFETTKMLADISAGLDVGMDRIILAYGQVKSAAFLRGQEVRQFTEAGIPILDELAKKFTELEGRAVSTGEVFDKISKRLVSFEMVDDIFKDLTSEGGKFFQMQEVLSETLAGKVSNLRDAYEIMLSEIGESNKGILTGTVDLLRTLMENWEKLRPAIYGVVAAMATYGTGLVLVAGYHKALALRNMIKQFLQLRQVIGMLSAATKAFGFTAKTAFGFVGLIAGIITAIITAKNAAGELDRELHKIADNKFSESERLVSGFDQLLDRLKNATQGSQNYREAISELNRRYGDYLPKLMSEADAYDNIAAAAKNAETAIRNKAKADAYEKGASEIDEKYGKDILKSMSLAKGSLLGSNWRINNQNVDTILGHLRSAFEDKDNKNKSVKEIYKEIFDKYFNTNIQLSSATDFSQLKNLRKAIEKYAQAREEFEKLLDIRFSNTEYRTEEERIEVEKIKFDYDLAVESLKAANLSLEEYNKELKKLKTSKLEKLVQLYKELERPEMAKAFQAELDSLLKLPTGWQKLVADVFKGIGVEEKGAGDFGLWADETTKEKDYIKDLREAYKGLDQDIKDLSFSNPEEAEQLQKQKQLIESIAKALEISLNTESNTGNGGKSPQQIEIERQIALVEELKDSYRGLIKAGFSSESAVSILQSVYKDSIKPADEAIAKNKEYEKTLKALSDELRKYDAEAADRVLLSKESKGAAEQLNLIKEAKTLFQDYMSSVSKWKLSDMGLSGSGIAFDISKIASDLQTEFNEIEAKEKKLLEMRSKIEAGDEASLANLRMALGEEVWAEYLKNGKDVLDQLAAKEKNAAKASAQEKLNDLSQKYVKEVYFDNGIDLSEFGDKTLSQVRELRKTLQNMLTETPLIIPVDIQNKLLNTEGYDAETGSLAQVDLQQFFSDSANSGIVIDEQTKSMLELMKVLSSLGIGFDEFGEKVKEVMTKDVGKSSMEEAKKTMASLKQLSGAVGSLGQTFIKLGEASDIEILSGIGKGLATLNEFVDILTESEAVTGMIANGFKKAGKEIGEATKEGEKLAESGEDIFKSSDWITMVLKVAFMLINKIIEGITGASAATQKAIEDAQEYKLALDEIDFGDRMSRFDTIFGIDGFGKYKHALQEAADYADKINSTLNSATEREYNFMLKKAGQQTILGEALYETVKRPEAQNSIVVDRRTGWQKFWNSKKSKKMISTQNMSEFFDDEGRLMTEKLQKWYEINQEYLDKTTQLYIEEMIAYGERYDEAMQEVADYVSSIFDNLASDITDSMIDSFLEFGDAATGLEDVFENLGMSIVKSLLQSFIIDKILNKYEEKIDKLFQDSGGLTDQSFWTKLSGVFGGIKNDIEGFAPYLNQTLKDLQDMGLLPESENSGGDSLGNGIKNITEDTANLLASYLNAIRADVSYSKTLWISMDASTKRISSILLALNANVPRLIEYQAQIAANTYDTAVATNDILNELLEVFTYEGGSKAVRVYS